MADSWIRFSPYFILANSILSGSVQGVLVSTPGRPGDRSQQRQTDQGKERYGDVRSERGASESVAISGTAVSSAGVIPKIRIVLHRADGGPWDFVKAVALYYCVCDCGLTLPSSST